MKLSKQTLDRIAAHEALGFEILIGNDWRLPDRPKWRKHEVVRICQTNSKSHGRCVRTIFAVRPLEVTS